jgi:hypothetical protein
MILPGPEIGEGRIKCEKIDAGDDNNPGTHSQFLHFIPISLDLSGVDDHDSPLFFWFDTNTD